ncbi:MAG: hypothetical protein COA69_09420 [Robiginitomaculum sp.]|nr:MAG: hypothetical protein COA69_09420 [Robiginitomaculum sp.]
MNNPRSNLIPHLLLAPQAVGTSTVTGVEIIRPWESGRNLICMVIGGTLAAADAIAVTVMARRKGTTTWDNVKEDNGTTSLAFTVAKLSDGGAVENGIVFGNINLARLKSGTNLDAAYEYDALRFDAVNANNSSPGIIGLAGAITDLYEMDEESSAEDDLYFKQTPHSL